jgi:hypothetical protein
MAMQKERESTDAAVSPWTYLPAGRFHLLHKPAVFLASFCLLCAGGLKAHAVEDITPFLPGVTIGVPVGMLPPPGLYFSSANTVFDLNVKNDQGQNTGVRVSDPSFNQTLLYVPDLPKIFGATYGAFITQGIRAPSTSIPEEGTFSNFGLVNTVISPLNLSLPIPPTATEAAICS